MQSLGVTRLLDRVAWAADSKVLNFRLPLRKSNSIEPHSTTVEALLLSLRYIANCQVGCILQRALCPLPGKSLFLLLRNEQSQKQLGRNNDNTITPNVELETLPSVPRELRVQQCEYCNRTKDWRTNAKDQYALNFDLPFFVQSYYIHYSLSCVHILVGRWIARPSPAHTLTSNKTYAKFPPKMLWSSENANSDVAAAGPIARWIETIVWAIPFVTPRDRLLGAA